MQARQSYRGIIKREIILQLISKLLPSIATTTKNWQAFEALFLHIMLSLATTYVALPLALSIAI